MILAFMCQLYVRSNQTQDFFLKIRMSLGAFEMEKKFFYFMPLWTLCFFRHRRVVVCGRLSGSDSEEEDQSSKRMGELLLLTSLVHLYNLVDCFLSHNVVHSLVYLYLVTSITVGVLGVCPFISLTFSWWAIYMHLHKAPDRLSNGIEVMS